MRMVLPVQGGVKGAKVQEWVLVELQGHIEFNGENLKNETVGPIFFDSQGHPTLQIGNHHLQGKKVPLKNPFLVLESSLPGDSSPSSTKNSSPLSRKRKGNPGTSEESAKKRKEEKTAEVNPIEENLSDVDSKWMGVALIRSKYLFKNRPKPVPRHVVID
mmetsp:Transcript_24767/g.38592  ORF Transcript_24767/g.38592 Transcript_24767/m.38592 type:complete len:160 (-) Transcript_24767:67-546(-)|eukprot:CAMPEP_0201512298 /NCGR_PEP_ID=MMETSP0161_2-20130828/4593_1 /ASSEMBLY_ACC=CAM_ASM_000251 /TAXON_ID=180227 /ORGANISM="Neoparamoeba aestuarina, Strain SoJaBio B1-5/56/2" /LENGTH=159 /DNA_ID=CAMNT_0047908113 /DNA_START=42 /DNA_END=521 /DNA_ORIENTATION=-